ncbi:hypothetical protein ACWKSP_26580 [Micromonosporaceae bacterium Da 78-11]
MPFPDSDLELTCQVAFGADLTAGPDTWAMTDLSSRVIDTPITVSHGVLVGTGTTRTGQATGLTLLNDDGALTPLLATSPYWPYVDVGTPVRLSVRTNPTYLTDTFTRTVSGGWGTSDNGLPWVLSSAIYSVTGGVAKTALSSAGTIGGNRVAVSHRDVQVTFDAALATASTGASNAIGPQLRTNAANTAYLWPMLEFGVGGIVYWTIRVVVSGTFTVIAQAAVAGLTYTSGTLLRARVELIGSRLRCRAWLASGAETSVWTIDTEVTNPLVLGSGYFLGMRAQVTAGNTNTMPNPFSIDNLSFVQPQYPIIEGFITDVRPSFRPIGDGTTHSVVQVDVGGVGSRLERRDAPEWGPLRRSLQYSPVPPYAYWPLEDKAGSTSAASAFAGQDPMVVAGPVVFEFDGGEDDPTLLATRGSLAICSVGAGGRLSAAVPMSSVSSAWTVSATVALLTAAVGGYTEIRALEWATPSGTFTRWALISTLTGHTVRAYNDAAGTSADVVTFANVFNTAFGIDVTATQVGGNINLQLMFVGNLYGVGSVAGTLGPVTRITVNPDRANTTASTNPFGIRFSVNHVMVHDVATAAALPSYVSGGVGYRADKAWNAESARRRLQRLCDEERISLAVYGEPDTTGNTLLGAQQPGSFTDLVNAAAEAESGGLLVEEAFGLAHVPRTVRYNRPVDLTVDLATYRLSDGTSPEDVLVPKLDARGANYVTVERTGGGSGSHAADAAYRLRRGTIAEKKTLDLYSDADTAPHAQWRVHTAVDGKAANYPNLQLDLAANPALIDNWLHCGIGSRVQRTNQPTIAGLETIDQVVDGITQTFSRRTWAATLDCSPAIVWDTGVWDDPNSRWDAATTTLAAPMSSTATMLPITSISGEAWSSADVPYTVQVDGEQMTVTRMSAPGFLDTADGSFESGVAGWTGYSGVVTSTSVLAQAGTKSALLTVTGTPGQAYMRPPRAPVTAGLGYLVVGQFRSPTALPNVTLAVDWFDATGNYLTTSVNAGGVAANTWTAYSFTFTAPTGAVFAEYGPTVISPPGGTLLYVDEVHISPAVATAATRQVGTVTRSVNSVVAAHLAGAQVGLANPARWGL